MEECCFGILEVKSAVINNQLQIRSGGCLSLPCHLNVQRERVEPHWADEGDPAGHGVHQLLELVHPDACRGGVFKDYFQSAIRPTPAWKPAFICDNRPRLFLAYFANFYIEIDGRVSLLINFTMIFKTETRDFAPQIDGLFVFIFCLWCAWVPTSTILACRHS